MREHPIPQDLTGYRFHIVGNMTLKQFVEVAAGVVVSVILYNTNLIPIVKWPLILASFGIGAAIAWVPIEERPLDHWVTTFFSVLYKPTKFFWRKQPKVPEPFLFKPRTDQVNVPDDVDLTPARQARIREYITSVNAVSDKDPWELEQDQQINQMLSVFDDVEVSSINITKRVEKPNLEVRVRDLHDYGSDDRPAPQTNKTIVVTPTPITDYTSEIEASNQDLVAETPPQPSTEIELQPQTASETRTQPTQADTQNMARATASVKTYEQEGQAVQPNDLTQSPAASFMSNLSQVARTAPQESVTVNSSLPFPSTPTQPNKLVGMVLDAEQKIVPNAIVEIKNLQGLVARAVKTNPLGQFFITTPLEDGTYIVSADKAGLNFPEQQLVLTSQIVPPIQISASV